MSSVGASIAVSFQVVDEGGDKELASSYSSSSIIDLNRWNFYYFYSFWSNVDHCSDDAFFYCEMHQDISRFDYFIN